MRALVDWYFTAYPPIMHDLHESLPLLYTYSGGAPQNPNLDPILFTELPFFSNFELAQMTKWGMPGVYTHAFMDGWSPGYLGSVAYNHNGMMRMYETQSGREPAAAGRGGVPASGATACGRRCGVPDEVRGCGRRRRCADGRGAGAASAQGARGCGECGGRPRRRERGADRGGRRPAGAAVAARQRGRPTGRGGGQPREWYRGIPIPPGAARTSRAATTPTTCRPACSAACSSRRCSRTWWSRTSTGRRRTRSTPGKTEAPYGYVIPAAARHDARRDARQHPARRSASRSGRRPPRSRSATARSRPARTSSSAISRTAGSPRTCSRSRTIPIPTCAPTTTAAGRWGWRCTSTSRRSRTRRSSTCRDDAGEGGGRRRARSTGTGTAGLAVAHYGSNNMIALPLQAEERRR